VALSPVATAENAPDPERPHSCDPGPAGTFANELLVVVVVFVVVLVVAVVLVRVVVGVGVGVTDAIVSIPVVGDSDACAVLAVGVARVGVAEPAACGEPDPSAPSAVDAIAATAMSATAPAAAARPVFMLRCRVTRSGSPGSQSGSSGSACDGVG